LDHNGLGSTPTHWHCASNAVARVLVSNTLVAGAAWAGTVGARLLDELKQPPSPTESACTGSSLLPAYTDLHGFPLLVDARSAAVALQSFEVEFCSAKTRTLGAFVGWNPAKRLWATGHRDTLDSGTARWLVVGTLLLDHNGLGSTPTHWHCASNVVARVLVSTTCVMGTAWLGTVGAGSLHKLCLPSTPACNACTAITTPPANTNRHSLALLVDTRRATSALQRTTFEESWPSL